jgi:hypothetical protein
VQWDLKREEGEGLEKGESSSRVLSSDVRQSPVGPRRGRSLAAAARPGHCKLRLRSQNLYDIRLYKVT